MEAESDPPKRLVSTWESLIKNNDGEAEVHTLHKYEVEQQFDEQSLISQAAPTIIRPSRRGKPARQDTLSIAFGDAQIPFQSENAMRLVTLACRELQPDNIVLTGDMLDLPASSKYQQRPEWQQTTQGSLNRYHTFLSQLRADSPNARIVAVGGNHEQRMLNSLINHNAELLGLKRANVAGELAVMTIPFLARFAELDVENVDGWPNGMFWLEDNLKVMHGTQTRKGGGSAASYLRSEAESTIFGHDHRLQLAYRTIARRLGHSTIAAASPGCLADIEKTPGVHHTVNSENEVVGRAEDWQHGLVIATHNPRVHELTPVRITEDGINLWGKHYG